jgi:hypothetical protein
VSAQLFRTIRSFASFNDTNIFQQLCHNVETNQQLQITDKFDILESVIAIARKLNIDPHHLLPSFFEAFRSDLSKVDLVRLLELRDDLPADFFAICILLN